MSSEKWAERHEQGSDAVQALNEIKSAENPDGTFDAVVHDIPTDKSELDMSGDIVEVVFDVNVGEHIQEERPSFRLDFPDVFVTWASDAESPVGSEVRLERVNDDWSLPLREHGEIETESFGHNASLSNGSAKFIFPSTFVLQLGLMLTSFAMIISGSNPVLWPLVFFGAMMAAITMLLMATA
jgi:hypothetical protein